MDSNYLFNNFWNFSKCLRMAESGDKRLRYLGDHTQVNLKVIPTKSDLYFCFQFEDDRLSGINRSYADGLLRVVMDNWKLHSNAIFERFETSGNSKPSFTLVGIHITQFYYIFHIDQDFHMSEIEQISSITEYSEFSSMRMKLK